MRIRPAPVLVLVLCAVAPAPVRADVLFFVNDAAGFAEAAAALTLLGSEDWSSTGQVPATAVGEPLVAGIPNGIFPNGIAAATGLTVQSDTLGLHAANANPGGGLFFAPSGFEGLLGVTQPSNQLSANNQASGFDVIFSVAPGGSPIAVALSPMYYRLATPGADSGDIDIAVFDDSNELLGTVAVPDVVDVLEDAFLGIVLTEGDVLGRVNLWAGVDATTGADNLSVYIVPEPAAGAGAMAVSVLVLLRARRSRLIGPGA